VKTSCLTGNTLSLQELHSANYPGAKTLCRAHKICSLQSLHLAASYPEVKGIIPDSYQIPSTGRAPSKLPRSGGRLAGLPGPRRLQLHEFHRLKPLPGDNGRWAHVHTKGDAAGEARAQRLPAAHRRGVVQHTW
jgi:hypothetical protein